jgi:radical SAM protein with 4Fe4S-binding SPASM domain
VKCFRASKSEFFKKTVNTGAIIDLSAISRVLNDLSNGTFAVNFGFSGECLLEKDLLFTLVSRANNAGFIDKRVITNAVLLDSGTISRAIGSGLDYFSVSVDAGTPETYNKLKGRDRFAQVLDAVEHFWELKKEKGVTFPLLRTSFYVCEENKDELEMFCERFEPISDFIDIQGFYEYDEVRINREWEHSCSYPFKRLGIRANGDVAPCCSMFGKVLGNIQKDSILDLWHGDEINAIRMQLTHKYYSIECRRCIASMRPDLLEKA